jgi:hypothetical protein
MRLNQIIAVVNSVKSRTQHTVTECYKLLQKPDLFDGMVRTYRPKDEETGEKFPGEQKLVQCRVSDLVGVACGAWEELINTVEKQDRANTAAQADIVVGANVIARAVPVTHLLFLEKHLTDIRTFIEKIPTLSLAEEWKWSDEGRGFRSPPRETVKTKKVPKVVVKYEATERHPAQTEMIQEDVVIGFWETVKFNTAIPQAKKQEMLDRVTALQNAVKVAREEANAMEVLEQPAATRSSSLLNFIFAFTDDWDN